MLEDKNLINLDLQHVWHPCSQMKDYEQFKPLIVSGAEGSYLTLKDGRKIIDAISSWWCKSLGHAHQRLKEAIYQQINRFEHVILANTTHECIVNLSVKLTGLTRTLKKVFYAGDGSSAIEIAMKMSLHARFNEGKKEKKHFIALKNAYHGETLGALSVSDVDLYRLPYESHLFNTHYISAIPYVLSDEDPLWQNCEAYWEEAKKELDPLAKKTTAILIEPILQGAGGMLIYSQDFLSRLSLWCLENDVHLIADEIMTGCFRTGKMFASQHAHIEPDFLCLSKGLTSGWMAFSAVMTRNDIYDLFYHDYDKQLSFLHSHTYSGNALGAALALATITFMNEASFKVQVHSLGEIMKKEMLSIKEKTGLIKNVRQIGAMVAADLIHPTKNDKKRWGYYIYQEAVKRGALLRPLGNTLYWLPPLTTERSTIEELAMITQASIASVMKNLC